MLRTFNCGIGMIVIAERDQSHDVESTLKEVGEHTVRLGRLTSHTPHSERVQFQGTLRL
jgi:phosphoribosylformylglycinamidine cyclo-ligase